MGDKLTTQPYKGSRDFFPEEMRFRSWMFHKMGAAVQSFGFERVDAPLIEPIEIYLAKTSEEIVGQQIYAFTDRGGRNVAIRPEMTPTVARMVAAKIRELPRPIRWYSIPNLWRYERPGKGRLREHWQLNVDIFGARDPFLADVEILQVAVALMREFSAKPDQFNVYLNHREILNAFLENILGLPNEKWAEVTRVMDKKEKVSPEEFAQLLGEQGLSGEKIEILKNYLERGFDFLRDNSEKLGGAVSYLFELMEALEAVGLKEHVQYNPGVVRGFDYYTGIVFEIFDNHPDNRRSLFGGGRYDNLVGAFSKESLNAVGFGMGDVTFQEFLRLHDLLPQLVSGRDVYVCSFAGSQLRAAALAAGDLLRRAGLRVEVSGGGDKLKKQFEEADAKKVPFAILIGDEELQSKSVVIKDMAAGSQEVVELDKAAEYLKSALGR